MTEQTGSYPTRQLLEDQLSWVNGQIRLLIGSRSHHLTFLEHEQLDQLHLKKNPLLIQVLELRQSGDEMIKLNVLGRAEEELHPFSKNRVVVRFLHPEGGRDHLVAALLAPLREHYEGDITKLLGTPDAYLEESDEEYLVRTIREVNAVGNGIERIDLGGRYADLSVRGGLERLKVMLAERVLGFKLDHGDLGRQIEVEFLEVPHQPVMELIGVSLSRPSLPRIGFHLLPPDRYLFPNKLAQLIEAGGGYDFITQRR